MKMPSKVKFANEKIKKAFCELEEGSSEEKELFKLLTKALNEIEENAFSGIQISKKLIPKEYLDKYGVDNVWKYNLPKGWMLIYSITKEEIIVISLVLEWFDHKDYEKRFKY
jgi:hypothetical protein